MKNMIRLSIIIAIVCMAQFAFAGYYSYHFKDNSPSPLEIKHDNEKAYGNIELPLKMNVWIKEANNIMVKIEKMDETGFPEGRIYLQKNTNLQSTDDRIDCSSNDNSGYLVNGNYSKTLISNQSLEDIPAKWSDNTLDIFCRYENNQGDYAWIGPVKIVREVTTDSGSLEVILTPKEAVAAGAMWSFQNEDGSWSDWLESGKIQNNLTIGDYLIRFKSLTNAWIPPTQRMVTVELSENPVTIKEIYKSQMGGGIQFLIEPAEVVEAGAMCRAKYSDYIGFSEWLNSGEIASGFNPGATLVQCKSIDGWDTPEPFEIEVPVDVAAVVDVTYCKIFPYKAKNVNATKGIFTDKVILTWEAISCVTIYDIYRSTDSNITFNERIAADWSDVSFEDFDADPSYEYYYSIVGKNINGEGEFSEPVVGFKKLRAPTNIQATDGLFTNKVRIIWDSVPGAKYYAIFQNSENDSDSAKCISKDLIVTDTIFDDVSSIPEKKYFYFVKAINDFNTSEYSEGDEGSMDLGIPANVKASECTYDDRVLISWDPVYGATSYFVKYRSEDSRKRSNETKEQELETEYLHLTANPGEKYFYQVRAENPFGKGEWSAPRYGCQAMKAPEVYASKRTYTSKIRVSWTKVIGVTGYRLYRSKQDDFSTAEILKNEVIGVYQDDSTNDTSDFYYWVEARNDYTSQISKSARGYISDQCVFEFSSIDTIEMEPTGGTSEICISAENTCKWDAESFDDWLHFDSPTSGTGSACFTVRADQASSAAPRQGSIGIAGQNIIVQQSGLNTFALSISKKGNGKIRINDKIENLPYMKRFMLGADVKIEAIPGTEWQFNYFSGDITDSENPMIVTIDRDVVIEAQFSPVKYFVNVSREGSGTILINGEDTFNGLFAKGDRVILKAEPVNQFSGWIGSTFESSENPYGFTVDSDITVMGKFDGWTLDIFAEGANLGGLNKNVVTIGVASRDVSVSAPPPSPRYSCYMAIFQDDDWANGLIQKIYTNGSERYVWVLSVDPKGNQGVVDEPGKTVLSWDPTILNMLPENDKIQLRKGTNGTGAVVVADMRKINTYEVNGTHENHYFSVILETEVKPDKCLLENTVQMNLQLEADNLGGAYKYNVKIGTSTFGIMTSAAPKPPFYSCFMVAKPVPDWQSSLAEYVYKCDNNRKVWVLVIDPAGNTRAPNAMVTSILSWDLSGTGTSGKLQLVSGHEGEGEIVVEDMRQTSSCEITGTGEMYYRIIWSYDGEKKCMTFDLEQDWNLISLGVYPDNNDLNVLFPGAEVAYAFRNGAYESVTNLVPGEGYWVRMPEAKSIQVCGQVFNSYEIELGQGWHLKGCTYGHAYPESINNQIEVMYEYIMGSYVPITECNPGFGFWVRMKADDTFSVPNQ